MRFAGFMCTAFVAIMPASAQTPQSMTGDFDGDGRADIVESRPYGEGRWEIVVRLAAAPQTEHRLVSGPAGSGFDNALTVRSGGTFAITGFLGERTETFAHDVILGPRRPGVRSLKYWNGHGFAGTWLPD